MRRVNMRCYQFPSHTLFCLYHIRKFVFLSPLYNILFRSLYSLTLHKVRFATHLQDIAVRKILFYLVFLQNPEKGFKILLCVINL